MKILKGSIYSFGKNVTCRDWILVHGDGKLSLIVEMAEVEYSEAQKGIREAFTNAPKMYQVQEGLDSIDSWPELDSSELRSVAEWVVQGKNSHEHPDASPVLFRGDGLHIWANDNPPSKDEFIYARQKRLKKLMPGD